MDPRIQEHFQSIRQHITKQSLLTVFFEFGKEGERMALCRRINTLLPPGIQEPKGSCKKSFLCSRYGGGRTQKQGFQTTLIPANEIRDPHHQLISLFPISHCCFIGSRENAFITLSLIPSKYFFSCL